MSTDLELKHDLCRTLNRPKRKNSEPLDTLLAAILGYGSVAVVAGAIYLASEVGYAISESIKYCFN